MIVSYCKKCKKESAGSVCQYCGKRAPSSAVRDVWRTVRIPLTDAGVWKSIALVLAIVTVLLCAILFGLERIFNTKAEFSALLNGQLLTLILTVPFAGVGISFLFLTLQGREEVRFFLDQQGAHTQVWHRASRLRSLGRLQASRLNDTVSSNDGTKYILADERHMLWADVNEIRYLPSSGLIRLYHIPHFAPLVLRIPPEEYDIAEAIVKKYAKIKD